MLEHHHRGWRSATTMEASTYLFAVSEFNGQCFKVFINLREGFGDRWIYVSLLQIGFTFIGGRVGGAHSFGTFKPKVRANSNQRTQIYDLQEIFCSSSVFLWSYLKSGDASLSFLTLSTLLFFIILQFFLSQVQIRLVEFDEIRLSAFLQLQPKDTHMAVAN